MFKLIAEILGWLVRQSMLTQIPVLALCVVVVGVPVMAITRMWMRILHAIKKWFAGKGIEVV